MVGRNEARSASCTAAFTRAGSATSSGRASPGSSVAGLAGACGWLDIGCRRAVSLAEEFAAARPAGGPGVDPVAGFGQRGPAAHRGQPRPAPIDYRVGAGEELPVPGRGPFGRGLPLLRRAGARVRPGPGGSARRPGCSGPRRPVPVRHQSTAPWPASCSAIKVMPAVAADPPSPTWRCTDWDHVHHASRAGPEPWERHGLRPSADVTGLGARGKGPSRALRGPGQRPAGDAIHLRGTQPAG